MQSSKLEMRISQTKTRADQGLLWTMKFYEQQLKKNPGNTVRDYAEELGVFSRNISHHLKLIDKVKKKKNEQMSSSWIEWEK